MAPLKKRLTDSYRFPGFTPEPVVRGVFGDPYAVVVTLKRREKRLAARCVIVPGRPSMTVSSTGRAISVQATGASTWSSSSGASSAGGVRR